MFGFEPVTVSTTWAVFRRIGLVPKASLLMRMSVLRKIEWTEQNRKIRSAVYSLNALMIDEGVLSLEKIYHCTFAFRVGVRYYVLNIIFLGRTRPQFGAATGVKPPRRGYVL